MYKGAVLAIYTRIYFASWSLMFQEEMFQGMTMDMRHCPLNFVYMFVNEM